jgi:hypothetical protein
MAYGTVLGNGLVHMVFEINDSPFAAIEYHTFFAGILGNTIRISSEKK